MSTKKFGRGSPRVDEVYQRFCCALSGAKCPAGTELKSTQIARELGFSRTPVVQALQRLAADGIVLLEVNKRAVVRPGAENWLVEIHQMRELLEPHAAAPAAERISDAKLAGLEPWPPQRPARQPAIGPRGRGVRFRPASGHRRASGNFVLGEAIRKCWSFKRLSYAAAEEPHEVLDKGYHEHLAMLDALRPAIRQRPGPRCSCICARRPGCDRRKPSFSTVRHAEVVRLPTGLQDSEFSRIPLPAACFPVPPCPATMNVGEKNSGRVWRGNHRTKRSGFAGLERTERLHRGLCRGLGRNGSAARYSHPSRCRFARVWRGWRWSSWSKSISTRRWPRRECRRSAWSSMQPQFPELADEEGLPTDLIYEEFHVRKQHGESVEVSEFLRAFSPTGRSTAGAVGGRDARAHDFARGPAEDRRLPGGATGR